jgi:two-component system OmpR family response regulator
MRVLLVEDEADLAATLTRALGEAAFAVDVAADGNEALYRATEIAYGAIVLDVMLPGRDGWQVLRELRSQGRPVPVIMLTARDTPAERVKGLNLGADDYLTKPFSLDELIARLRALARRAAGSPWPDLRAGDIHLDTAARRAFRGGSEVKLTGRELNILELLLRRAGEVVSRTEISEHLYNDDSELLSNAIDVHVASLRRKLGADIIETRRGLGYLIDC